MRKIFRNSLIWMYKKMQDINKCEIYVEMHKKELISSDKYVQFDTWRII